MHIREAVAGDIPELIMLIKNVFDEFGFTFIARDELPDFIDFNKVYSKDRSLYVLEHDRKLIGCGALQIEGNKGTITRIYLSKEFRGKGLGKKIVNYIIEAAKKAGCSAICLWTDTRFTVAHTLYSSIGFIRTERLRPLNDVNNSYEVYFEMNINKD